MKDTGYTSVPRVSRSSIACTAIALLVVAAPAFAHRVDEYLQSTLIDIAPGSITLQINLTPGVACARAVIFMIDLNADGTISAAEARAYAGSLRHDLTLHLDGEELPLELSACSCPPPAELRSGSGIIQIEFTAPARLAPGAHTLAFENRHLPPISVYLINAALPRTPGLHITGQSRNDNQSQGQIDFTLDAPPPNYSGHVAAALVCLFLVLLIVQARRKTN